MLLDNIFFCFKNYFYLFAFAISCFGFGFIASKSWLVSKPFALRISLAIGIGMGFIICILEVLGALGLFRVELLAITLASGFVPLIYYIKTDRNQLKSWFKLRKANTSQDYHWVFPLAVGLICIELVLRPLSVPLAFDELMYHLPHAKAWSDQGKLTIDTWLRYPYFPYNFNLLFAAGLSFNNEIFSHMVHSLTGWLCLLGMFGIAESYLNRSAGFIAVIIFSISNAVFFSTAMIDFSVCMFIFFSFICTYLWWEDRSFSAIAIAVFLFGVAAGIKYQALLFAPLLSVVVLARIRESRKIFMLLMLFLIPCGYWYIRNYVLVGDPFSPMGSSIFGYSDWNAGDMQIQLADIAIHKDWPGWALWPAAGSIVLWLQRKCGFLKACIIFSGWGFLTWIVTSHYSRYLMPVTPILSILSAYVIYTVYLKVCNSLAKATKVTYVVILQNLIAVVFLVALSFVVIKSSIQNWSRIHASEIDKSAYLKTQLRSYEIAEYLRDHKEFRLVQFDFGSDIYYLPANTIGDVFGPGRIRDFQNLSSSELAAKIKSLNANAVLLPGESHVIAIKKGLPIVSAFDGVKNAHDFAKFFELVKKTPEAELYKLRAED